jgi:hypothetical protein
VEREARIEEERKTIRTVGEQIMSRAIRKQPNVTDRPICYSQTMVSSFVQFDLHLSELIWIFFLE